MYTNLINKMVNHFSELGSILYSKACDYSGMYQITKDDIMMYYELLNSEENICLPENVCKNNHLSCCLYYLTKEDADQYKEIFLSKFIANISVDNLVINKENLVLIFNIIEFDRVFLNSQKEYIQFLYSLLKSFSNFPTVFENFIIFKYFRGFLKFRLGQYDNTNKEYLEIVAELSDYPNQNFFVKYIKLKNDLLKVKLYHTMKKKRSDYLEYWEFLKSLYEEVKNINKTLAIKLGLDLFSAYLDGKNYDKCIPLLIDMKKLLKKELLKGTTMSNGLDYYLAVSSRLGYMGILLDNTKAVNSAIKKIKKTLDIIKNDKNNEKLIQISKAYIFILAILEVSITKKTDFDLKTLAFDFQKAFLPDFNNKSNLNYLINEQNKENIIIDFKVINNMNSEITNCAKNVLNKCVLEIQKKNNTNSIFLTFLSAVHDKVYRYSESYISDKSEDMRKFYKTKIMDYTSGVMNFVYKLMDDEPLLYTKYVKTMLLNIFSSYTHIFIYEKNITVLKKIIRTIDDLIKKLNIEKDIPSYALIYKIKGDFWFLNKDYKAAITYYENALKLFESNNPKIPTILFNIGCANFFIGNKPKTIEYLNKSISEFNNILLEKNIFGFSPDFDAINKKINHAKKLLTLLS